MCFNTQPPEGGCIPARSPAQSCRSFNTQPPEGGCLVDSFILLANCLFQHTAARRRLLAFQSAQTLVYSVSTHSRPKAAATPPKYFLSDRAHGFNTQPPEGGCLCAQPAQITAACFNTQPPEGGCQENGANLWAASCFNTQPPEGGCGNGGKFLVSINGFNTQPPEGGCPCTTLSPQLLLHVSTHSRPKAAALLLFAHRNKTQVSTHSRPKAAASKG